MKLVGQPPALRPLCRDVLDPDFAAKNKAVGYNPAYNYVGSDLIYRRTGFALVRYFFGADINPSAWLHDCDWAAADGSRKTFRDSNAEFRANVAKQIRAKGHPWAALLIGRLHWLGVANLLAWLNYRLCRKG